MRILLVDTGTKLPSLALMRLSTYHKALGDEVALLNFGDTTFDPGKFDQVYVSVIFTRSKPEVEKLRAVYGQKVIVGGPGWDLTTRLPAEIEACRPDWNLYNSEILYPRIRGPYSRQTRMAKAQMIADSGIGRLTSGCNRTCAHCRVPRMEGKLRSASALADLINPRSNHVHLLDNSIGDYPRALKCLAEAKKRGLVLNISQGIDVRSASLPFLQALVQTDLLGNSLYIAWDRMQDEASVLRGIGRLKPLAEAHGKEITCFVLTGFDTTFEQDRYRVEKLHELGIRPYVMPYEAMDRSDARMACFKRFVNAFFFKRMDFDREYEPWLRAKAAYHVSGLFAAA